MNPGAVGVCREPLIKHQFPGNFVALFDKVRMPAGWKSNARTELRRDRRYAGPALEVVIGGERFRAINWSMRGALLYGICEAVGMRVRGEMGVPGTCEGIPFAATVVRADLDSGNSAICFEDCRSERIEFPAYSGAAALQ